MRRKSIGLFLVLTALSFCLMGCGIEPPFMSTPVTNTFEIDNDFEDISIDSSSFDVSLLPSTNEECTVICEESSTINHNVEVIGNTLTIKQQCDFMSGLFSYKIPFRVTIYLPASAYNYLSVKLSSGDLFVSEDFDFENVTIGTSSGDVDFRTTVEDNMSVNTSSGDIMLLNLEAGNLNLCSSSGDVALTNSIVKGDLDISTSSGEVFFDASDAENINISTSSGDVRGTILSEKQFSAKTSSGDVDMPVSGGDGECSIKTSSGDIQLSYVQ